MKRIHYINNSDFTSSVKIWISSKEVQAMKLLSKEIQILKQENKEIPFPLHLNVIKQMEESRKSLHKKATGKIPQFMAECFLKLVERIGSRPNFMGYTYLDDMKGDALFLCVNYAHNFDPEKSNNAFAYFSSIVFNAFKQFLNKEKKLSDYKFDEVSNKMPNAVKLNWNTIMTSNRDSDGEYVDLFNLPEELLYMELEGEYQELMDEIDE